MTPQRSNGQLQQMLVEELQGLFDAENQLTKALPEMANAAQHPQLKQAFEKHLAQTENHIERLTQAFNLLGVKAAGQACRAMQGLIEAGQEKIAASKGKDANIADVSLATAAQGVEHYEMSAYGGARSLAHLIGHTEVHRLLSYTLGEEEATDYLLTEISKPLLQQALLNEMGAHTNLSSTGTTVPYAASSAPGRREPQTQEAARTETKVKRAH